MEVPAPSIAILSRVFKHIVQQGFAGKVFIDLVSQCREAGIINGQHLAIDSTAINAYEKKQSNSRSQDIGNGNWEVKKDTYGNIMRWLGTKDSSGGGHTD